MAVTRNDVAQLAGVSPALVSYVLNPGSRPVSAQARARIEAAIEELDYRPNAIAQALRRSTSMSIGLLVPNFINPFVAALSHEIETRAYDNGYVLFTGSRANDPERERDYVRSLVARSVDAMVIVGTASTEAMAEVTRSRAPTLVLDHVTPGLGLSSLIVDARLGAHEAVSHLIETHGRRRIACIAGDWPARSAVEDRVHGWRDALSAGGLRADDSLLVRVDPHDTRAGHDATLRLLHGPDPVPDAIYATSDVIAVGVISALHERGLVLPDAMPVVSFGGTALAEATHPKLTAVMHDFGGIATTIMQRLLELIADAQTPREPGTLRPETYDVLPATLVIRRSCGCPSSAGGARVVLPRAS